ncbi:MAG TPA: hypothetical protein VGK19_09115 [Capsulimonadaceae bacterium]|jgi:hypothetical protein
MIPTISAACTSGLAVIPTADVVGAKQFSIELQLDGTTNPLAADCKVFNAEFGIGDRLEVGVDTDLAEATEDRFFFNGKYVLGKSIDGKLAVAFGVCGFTPTGHFDSNPYVVATRDFARFRITAGASYLSRRTEAVIGVDEPLNEHVTLMLDHTTGPNNYSSGALNYQVSDHVGIMAGVLIPNSSSNDTRFSIHFVFGGALGK